VQKKIAASDKASQPAIPYLIIDEGQDMSREFYLTLINLGFENFFVVADQNQQITDQCSSRQDLENALVIDTRQVIELKENYRNALPVARLAREFYTGDPASPPPDLPSARHSVQQPLLIEYGDGCKLSFEQVIKRILKMADRDPSKLIGVITPNNQVRARYYDALNKSPVKLDNPWPRLVTYAYNEGAGDDHSFSEGGIFVINAQACKGLEFDTVFLADIHNYFCNPNIQDTIRKRFYVMVARAIERVLMLKEAGQHCPVEVILPMDETILGRWR
jgi:superfamily I DNA/RNA helicase